ncbi:TULIP family P47-like protein [Streptomyces sp. NPDC002537]
MPATKGTISTNGWDTAFVVPLSTVNDMIGNSIKMGEISRKLSDTVSISAAADAPKRIFCIEGEWESWALLGGGSGKYVHIRCLMKLGKFWQKGEGEKEDIFETDAVIVTAQVDLSTFATSNGQPAKKGSAEEPTIVLLSVAGDKAQRIKDARLEHAFNALLEKCLQGSITSLSKVFGKVNISTQAAKRDYSWLKSAYVAYAVASPSQDSGSVIDPEDCAFGVLSLVGDNKLQGLAGQVDLDALHGSSSGHNSSFVISRNCLTGGILKFGSMSAFFGSRAEDFELNKEGVLVNKNKISWGTFQMSPDDAASNFRPDIDVEHFRMLAGPVKVNLKLTGISGRYSGALGHLNVILNFEHEFGVESREDPERKGWELIPDFVLIENDKNLTDEQKRAGLAALMDVKTHNITAEPDTDLKVVEWVIDIAGGIVAAIMGEVIGKAIGKAIFKSRKTEDRRGPRDGVSGRSGASENTRQEERREIGVRSKEDAAVAARWVTLCAFLGTVIGGGVGAGATHLLIQYLEEREEGKFDSLLSLDSLAQAIVSAALFPEIENWEMLSGRLRGNLVLEGKLTAPSPNVS